MFGFRADIRTGKLLNKNQEHPRDVFSALAIIHLITVLSSVLRLPKGSQDSPIYLGKSNV